MSIRNVELLPTYPQPNCKRIFAWYSLIFLNLKILGPETLHSPFTLFHFLGPHFLMLMPICSLKASFKYANFWVFLTKPPNTLKRAYKVFFYFEKQAQRNWITAQTYIQTSEKLMSRLATTLGSGEPKNWKSVKGFGTQIF